MRRWQGQAVYSRHANQPGDPRHSPALQLIMAHHARLSRIDRSMDDRRLG
jgi:hypothetical protein